ncbi:MAG: class I SAM-dependent methyltransferase [Pseudomonadota bacterium]
MIKRYEFIGDDVAADIRERYNYDGDLAEIYATTRDYEVHKWHHYIPLYDRYLGRYRGTPVRMLEIGVNKGGSLQMWRRFLGPDAVLFGVDINPDCAALNGLSGQVRIGSQTDAGFLRDVVEEMGGVDVVLDDGSHKMRHIAASLYTLFPMLEVYGTYLIEDLHAAYWSGMGGGFRAPDNFYNTLRKMIDDMHYAYHRKDLQVPELEASVSGIHVHDSLVAIDKGPLLRPAHSKVF